MSVWPLSASALSTVRMSSVRMAVSSCDAGGLGRCDVVSPHKKALTSYHKKVDMWYV